MEPHSELIPAPRPAGAAPAERATDARIRLGAILAVVLAIAFGAWLILRDGGGESAPSEGAVSSAASVAQLRAVQREAGHPVYWAGPVEGNVYELTRPTDGNVYVRYLPPGTQVGDRKPEYTTIGTYPRPGALKGLRRLARGPEAVTFPLAGGGIAVYGRDQPNSVYLAFPGEDVQVEVYDPSPQEARRLARSGRVRPVG